MLFQIILDADDGHPVDARTTFIASHLPQCCLQVFSLTYFLHQSIRAGWVFGSIRRPGRFSLFPSRLSGFTRQRRREVQFDLDVLLLVVLETHGLLAAPSRSGLQPSFPAWPIHCSAFRRAECLTSLADVMTYYALLTSAPRSGCLSTASVAEATRSRSPGVSSAAFRAQSPNLRFAPLMDMNFAVSCPLVRRSRLISGSCSSTRTFDPCFFQILSRGDSPCIITRPSPPSVWPEDLHLQTAEHSQH